METVVKVFKADEGLHQNVIRLENYLDKNQLSGNKLNESQG
jgi:hypothetical protein